MAQPKEFSLAYVAVSDETADIPFNITFQEKRSKLRENNSKNLGDNISVTVQDDILY